MAKACCNANTASVIIWDVTVGWHIAMQCHRVAYDLGLLLRCAAAIIGKLSACLEAPTSMPYCVCITQGLQYEPLKGRSRVCFQAPSALQAVCSSARLSNGVLWWIICYPERLKLAHLKLNYAHPRLARAHSHTLSRGCIIRILAESRAHQQLLTVFNIRDS